MNISKETLTLVNTFKTPILKFLSDIKDEVRFYFDDSIIQYVEFVRTKFNKSSTFLFRNDKIDFYSTYFPIYINNRKEKVVIDKVRDLFSDCNFISIIGNAGSGKSMLLKDVFLKSIDQLTKIPIVLELRNLNNFNGEFSEYLIKVLSNSKLTPNIKILDRILARGEFIFLLDGYDEIFRKNKEKLTREIIEFIDKYYRNYFLVTSRPGANFESLPHFKNYHVNQLNSSDIEEFIKKQLNLIGDNELAIKMIKAIRNPKNKDYKEFLSSPLLLSMFILTFNSYPEIPKSKNKFFWNVFDTLCTKHDAVTKQGGFQHERKTGLQNEELERVLKWFSYVSFFKGIFSFDEKYLKESLRKIKKKLGLVCTTESLIYDLVVSISVLQLDGVEYRFPHKSLQEYFAALLIKELDEESKIEIYSKSFKHHLNNSFGGYENFWNLCEEMDEVAFKKHFLITSLKELIGKIDFSNDLSICKSFYKYFGFVQTFRKDEVFKINFVSYTFYSLINVSVLQYLNVLEFRQLTLTNRVNKLNSHFLEDMIESQSLIINKNKKEYSYQIDFYFNWSEKLEILLLKTGLRDLIIEVINSVKKKILDLELEVNKKEGSNKDLLSMLKD